MNERNIKPFSVPAFEFKPFEKRTRANQYKTLLRRILDEGDEIHTWQAKLLEDSGAPEEEVRKARALKLSAHQMEFNIAEGFPLITERDLSGTLSSAIAELTAFLNGARTLEELESFGCTWWDRWLTAEKCETFGLEPGDLGPGGYGPAWTHFPTAEGYYVNQIENVIHQIKSQPWSRTHVVTNWIPQYVVEGEKNSRKVVVAPCHGFFHIQINPETGDMDLHHIQRSADSPVGLVFDIAMYGALGIMLAQITGYHFRKLAYTTSDTHLYLGQIPAVEELLAQPDRKFPSVKVDNSDVEKISDYRKEHFTLEDDYEAGPKKKIETPT